MDYLGSNIFIYKDIINSIAPHLSIIDLIRLSRVNKLFYNCFISHYSPCLPFITKYKDTLDKISSPKNSLYYDLSTHINNEIYRYNNLQLPFEYVIFLKLLSFYNIPNIFIVNIDVIESSIVTTKFRKDITIPLFYLVHDTYSNAKLMKFKAFNIADDLALSGTICSYYPKDKTFKITGYDPNSLDEYYEDLHHLGIIEYPHESDCYFEDLVNNLYLTYTFSEAVDMLLLHIINMGKDYLHQSISR